MNFSKFIMNSYNIKAFQFIKYYFIGKSYSTRVRFAPSPTGLIHVGGLKTVLINFLFAKSTGGKLILRIEDTDRSRFDSRAINHFIKAIKWLNINFDEGITNDKPYANFIQSNRLGLYKDSVDHLIKSNKAYYCFCSNQRLAFLRQEQIRQGETPGYDRKCCHLTEKEIATKRLQQIDYTVRLKLTHRPVSFHDNVFGDITIPLSSIESDPIIFKSDGYPVYHLANVVDDHDMGITDVIRGQEWLVSTPKHIIIYEAFGWKPPSFAHLPLIVKENGQKVSKRDRDFHKSCYNIDSLIERGFTPESVISWLMSCGGGLTVDWYPQITLEQLIKKVFEMIGII